MMKILRHHFLEVKTSCGWGKERALSFVGSGIVMMTMPILC